TAKGDQWMFRLYVVRFGSDVYRFIFASKRTTAEVDRAFRESVGTFRRMTLAESQAAKPLHIKIVTVAAGDTVERMASRMAVSDRPVERFRVLNRLGPNDHANPGDEARLGVGWPPDPPSCLSPPFGAIIELRELLRGERMNIGFVGLGAMGAGIVPRLMAAGHAVTGWNRSKQKAEPLIAAGMRLAPTPRAVAAASHGVFSIGTAAAARRAVALGGDGIIAGLKKGGIYADMSTIAPDASRAICAEFAKQGVAMLDAPISGSPVTLAQGNAAVMVGGDKAAFERIEP